MFEDAFATLENASEELRRFRDDCAAFLDECGYQIIRKRDRTTDEDVIFLRFDKKPPPRLRAHASSILNNSRLAADIALHSAMDVTGFEREDRTLYYFPFSETKDAFDRRTKLLTGLDFRALDFIESVQPFRSGKRMILEAFRATGDKHSRVIMLTLGGKGFVLKSTPGMILHGPLKLGINKWNSLRNEVEYARVGDGGILQLEILPPKEVCLDLPADVFPGTAAEGLSLLIDEVQGVVSGLQSAVGA